jgi:hypothetical protein
MNLRLAPEILKAVDAARAGRAGNISRNTWITEAVEEKLARAGTNNNEQKIKEKRPWLASMNSSPAAAWRERVLGRTGLAFLQMTLIQKKAPATW